MLVAAGPGPHPTMLLLHGLPGNERNLDLAQAARRAGWNVLTFTYRGAWGSEGIFSIQHAVEDTRAAIGYLRSAQAGLDFNVDTSRIVVAGHSMGGYMAAHAAVLDARCPRRPAAVGPARAVPVTIEGSRIARPCSAYPPLAGLILLDAWDIAASARELKAGGAEARARFVAGFDDIGRSLGPITAEDLADNLIRRGEEWSLPALAEALARIRVLTIYATHGGAEENRAIAAAIKRACAPRGQAACPTLTAVELATDHVFADHRVALAREVVEWLGALGR